MKIGIVGAGHIGETLTRRLRALGHEVAVANSRGPETLADLARETGAHAATLSDTVRGRDLVIVTIPEKSVSRLPKQLFAAAGDAVVVDTGNYYPQRDGRIDAIEDGATESRYVARQIGHPVVKAFNTIHAQHLLEGGKPKGAPGRIALPVAGDDVKAKSTVMRLIDELGFDTVDGGGLDDSWRQQPGTPIYGADLPVGEARRALERAPRERPAGFRAAATPAP